MQKFTFPFQRVGVYGFVLNDKNEFLVIKRAEHDTSPGIWELPGGLLEINESIEEGIKREVKEETGLDVTVQHILAAKAMKTGSKRQHIRIAYKCRLTDITQGVKLSHEHTKFAWVTPDSLGDKQLSNFLLHVLDQLG